METPDLIHTIRHRVYFCDTDAGSVVYFGNMGKYIEMGFTEWFRHYAESLQAMNKRHRIFFVVKESHQHFRKPLHYDEEIQIITALKNMKFYTMTFTTTVTVNEEVRFIGETTLTPIDPVSSLPVKIPQEIMQLKVIR